MASLYQTLATCHPSIARGIVWCHECGRQISVDSGECFQRGWPKCCGQTMSIDSPEERRALKQKAAQR